MAETRPTGMRIQRPYATEDEFIRGDGLTIGRMGMILIGAPPRPPGIIIRFEIVLADGQAVFRGEGKVVAHRVHANGRKGLEVKFTKLDSHSKAVVERALELRKSGALTPSPVVTTIPDLTPSPAPSETSQRAGGVSVKHGEIDVTAGLDTDAPPAEPAHTEEPAHAEQPLEAQEPAHTEEPAHAEQPPEAEEFPRTEPAPPPPAQTETPPPRLTSDPPEIDVREESLPPGIPGADENEDAAADELAEQVESIEQTAVDDEPTPFAPPVMFDTSPEPPAVQSAPTQPVEAGTESVHTELDKLRTRKVSVQTPQDRESLLDKLRNRRKSSP
jgi:hypothetical protein